MQITYSPIFVSVLEFTEALRYILDSENWQNFHPSRNVSNDACASIGRGYVVYLDGMGMPVPLNRMSKVPRFFYYEKPNEGTGRINF